MEAKKTAMQAEWEEDTIFWETEMTEAINAKTHLEREFEVTDIPNGAFIIRFILMSSKNEQNTI